MYWTVNSAGELIFHMQKWKCKVLSCEHIAMDSFGKIRLIYVKFWLPWLLRRYSVRLQCGTPGFNSWVGKISWRRKWQSTPVLLPGKSHGQRSLVGYSPLGLKELDTTERLHFMSFYFVWSWDTEIRLFL